MTRRHSTAVGKGDHDRLGGGEMPRDEEELLVTVVGKEEMVDVCEGPGLTWIPCQDSSDEVGEDALYERSGEGGREKVTFELRKEGAGEFLGRLCLG